MKTELTMNRKNFLRNAMMALAVSLVPKILQPMLPDIQEEEMVDVEVERYIVGYDPYSREYNFTGKTSVSIMKLTRKNADLVAHYISQKNRNV